MGYNAITQTYFMDVYMGEGIILHYQGKSLEPGKKMTFELVAAENLPEG